MEVSSLTKLVQLPSFSGLQKDFQTWWIRFVAFTDVCKFQAARKNGGDTSMPSSDMVVIDLDTNVGEKIAAAKERNLVAMANLTMAFETESLFDIMEPSTYSV
jgi:hypothetical protein